jgi:hypothetical protein
MGEETMKLEQLEQEIKTQISIVEEEECRLKDWLESIRRVEQIVVGRGLDSADRNLGSQPRTFGERVPRKEVLDHLRLVCTQSVNPKDLFDERLGSLRQTLSIQPVKHSWKERFCLEEE